MDRSENEDWLLEGNNAWTILGVAPGSDLADVLRSFRRLSIRYHPDKQHHKTENEQAEAARQYLLISQSRDILTHPTMQALHDDLLARQDAEPESKIREPEHKMDEPESKIEEPERTIDEPEPKIEESKIEEPERKIDEPESKTEAEPETDVHEEPEKASGSGHVPEARRAEQTEPEEVTCCSEQVMAGMGASDANFCCHA